MGSKTMQVKGAGSQSFPTPTNTAPQCGSGNNFHRGQFLPFGVGFGVMQREKPHLSQKKKVQCGITAGVGLCQHVCKHKEKPHQPKLCDLSFMKLLIIYFIEQQVIRSEFYITSYIRWLSLCFDRYNAITKSYYSISIIFYRFKKTD
jgi:hypothetical protein